MQPQNYLDCFQSQSHPIFFNLPWKRTHLQTFPNLPGICSPTVAPKHSAIGRADRQRIRAGTRKNGGICQKAKFQRRWEANSTRIETQEAVALQTGSQTICHTNSTTGLGDKKADLGKDKGKQKYLYDHFGPNANLRRRMWQCKSIREQQDTLLALITQSTVVLLASPSCRSLSCVPFECIWLAI